MDSVRILNIDIDCTTHQELLQSLDNGVLFTPNVDHLVTLHDDPEFLDCYRRADYRICDSRVLRLCSLLLPRAIPEAIPGSSFFHEYCFHHAADDGCLIFLIGAAPGVAQKAAERINCRIGRRIVVGAFTPPFGREMTADEMQTLVDEVADSGATVAVVGLGSPKQEKWIMANRHLFPGVKLWMALGATIDFEAGNITRAPRWVQSICLEWFYRFLREPRRLFRRYFIRDPRFFYYFVRQLFKK